MSQTDEVLELLENSANSSTSKAAVRQVYARWAPFYNATFGALVSRYRRHLPAVVTRYNAKDILEVGVGTGGNLPYYPKGSQVVGIDVCEEMLAKAHTKIAHGVDADIELRLGDGEMLAFPDASFDLVVMLFVISVTPDPKALLAEVARVLRPGGHVLIINHFAGVPGIAWIERLLAPMADQVGFHSGLKLNVVAEHPSFIPTRVSRLWPIGFFSLLTLARRETSID